jgi:uncharacterized protein
VTVEVNITGMRCGAGAGGLSCLYCYQNPVRGAVGNRGPDRVDHARIREVVRSLRPGSKGFTVFGGEAMLASEADLEALWAFGLEEYGKNGVQTSGRPVTDAHVRLFQKYRVHVGFSIDGPDELNDARVAGTQEQTRAATAHSISRMRECLSLGIGTSLIVTLHRMNASAERLPRLKAWFRELDAAGLRSARLHLLERDGPGGDRLSLTDAENTRALLSMAELEAIDLRHLRFDVFSDIEKKLRDPKASASCVWNNCDPWTTSAVQGVEADGSRSLCQRVHKDGRQWAPADSVSSVRREALWSTPQDDGGCRGCRFFLQCGGQCPGTAIGGDWRKRTVDCRTWFAVMEHVESVMVSRGESPASLAPDLDVAAALSVPTSGHGDSHGDGHGDSHGDGHGDHTDRGGSNG